MQNEKSIAVLLTCHNRVSNTLRCLSHLFTQSMDETVSVTVYLVDDGSTDGTGEAVQNRYPDVKVIYADGSLFWNRGMHLAFGEALKVGFDYYLWLNDDTYLYEDSLQRLITMHEELRSTGKQNSMVVASTRDSSTGEFTYGGYRSIGSCLNPLRLQLTPPGREATKCDTMCGNCVLIPREVTDILGNMDSHYRHRWGDVDYGLRGRKNNCEVWIAPGFLADCDANPNEDRWRNDKLSLKQRIEELHSLKGLGRQDWYRFTRLHGGIFWPLIWIRPYLRLAYDSFKL